MPAITVIVVIQVVVALGLLNVWLIRPNSPTAYRGGQAQSLKEEFRAYGLPEFVFYLVGALKVGSALCLIAGIWVPAMFASLLSLPEEPRASVRHR